MYNFIKQKSDFAAQSIISTSKEITNRIIIKMKKIIKPTSQGYWNTMTGPEWVSLLPPFSSVPSHSTYFYSVHKQPKFKTKILSHDSTYKNLQ